MSPDLIARFHNSSCHSIINHAYTRENNFPALFLDRDGVIIEDMHYIKDPSKVAICAGALDLLSFAFELHIPVVIVTNQSGIGRGYSTWKDYINITNRMLKLLGECTRSILAIYANSLSSTDVLEHSWRKPSPGMFLHASDELGVCLSRSIMVGDRLTDYQASINAGLSTFVHVKTGNGKNERNLLTGLFNSTMNAQPLFLVNGLKDAISLLPTFISEQ